MEDLGEGGCGYVGTAFGVRDGVGPPMMPRPERARRSARTGPVHGATVEVTGLDERGARLHSALTGEPAGKG